MGKQYLPRYGNDQIEVVATLDDGTEVFGDLDAWEQLDDDTWRGHVHYAAPDPAGFTGMFSAWFPADRIRADETDHSQGR